MQQIQVFKRGGPISSTRTASPVPPPEVSAISAGLERAEQYADLANGVPAFSRLGVPLRFIARLTARALLFFSRFLTNRQREFNRAALQALRQLEECQQIRIGELERKLASVKGNLLFQEHRLGRLLDDARREPGKEGTERLQALIDDEQHSLDFLYLSFEDQFRGGRDEIRERLRSYLPILHNAGLGQKGMPILDVGCGRGEWLELLGEEGLSARGLDSNRIMVEECRQRNLEVDEGDVIDGLRRLPDASLGVVTGFHLIEHLPFPILIKLLDEAFRVLKPGGAAIFETPNPQNVLVGSCTFYLDPTHRNPLPSSLTRFLAEARGFRRVEVLDLHPFPDAIPSNGSALAQRFNELFYGPRDYAVVAWKVDSD